ncbi:sugar phosphate isomerase/epimerase family protein [Desulforamulus aquiferis]|uniref:Sugar phosphate isomerase/epimerase n=1 Tax=Desulforamulus aquiferis TaxID=1397668 RepID=A0AAW7ZAT6_9FIRM|nr:sugar phosphate isomerase/epimerase family protein [Desulforamulus aquiferis]MDO7786605.1 sugar phosphate isomerase/epimerase [Desulforamulus aquiferis]
MNNRDFSISSYALYEQPLQAALPSLIREGWRSIEILLEQRHRELLNWPDKRIIALREFGLSEGINWTLHAPIEQINPISNSPAVQKETLKVLLQSLDIAEQISCKYMVLHPGEVEGDTSKDFFEGRTRLVCFLQELLDRSKGNKTIIALENVPPYPNLFGWQVDELLYALEQIKSSRLGLVFDFGHAHMVNFSYCFEVFERILPELVGVHVSDNNGERDEHNPVGAGSVPYKQIIAALKRASFTGNIVLETRSIEESRASLENLQGLYGST